MSGILDDIDSRVGGPAPPSGILDDIDSRINAPAIEVRGTAIPQKPKQEAGFGGPMIPAMELLANTTTGLGNSIIGGWHGAIQAGSSLLQGKDFDQAMMDASNVVKSQQAKTYQPETEGGKTAVGVMQSGFNPLNWPSLAAHWAGEKAFEAGASPGLATGIEVVGNALPALGLFGKAGTAEQAAVRGRVEPRPFDMGAPPETVPGATSAAQAAASPVPMSSLVQKSANAPVSSVPEFATVDPAQGIAATKSQLPPESVAARSQVLERVGLPSGDFAEGGAQRVSAVSGDLQEAANQYTVKKLSSPEGEFWRAQFDKERDALTDHATGIVNDTGGTVALDEGSRYQQGTNIVKGIKALSDDLDNRMHAVYQEADKAAAGAPVVDLNGVKNLLDQRSAWTTADQMGLRRGIRAYMGEQDLLNADGSVRPMTVTESENLRKYINERSTYSTGKSARDLKNVIDEQVTSNAGSDVYAAGRALRQLQAKTFENPDGIASLLSTDPKSPVNRAVPYEQVGDKIMRMPVDQINQIVGVLKTAPENLQPQAQAALGEIRAAFASKALDLGSKRAPSEPWGANDVSKFLAQNNEKIATVFKDRPDILAKMQDLNDAGLILAPKTGYPGAAVQTHNLIQRGAIGSITPTTTAVGSFLFGPVVGGAGGALVGKYATGKVSNKMSLRNAQKQVSTTRLSDVNPP